MSAKTRRSQKEYQIGDLSIEFGATPRAIRFYEEYGLIKPRREGAKRLYSEGERQKLRLITFARSVDLSLAEIKELLAHFQQEADHQAPIRATIEKLTEHLDLLHDDRTHIDRAISRIRRCIPILKRKIA